MILIFSTKINWSWTTLDLGKDAWLLISYHIITRIIFQNEISTRPTFAHERVVLVGVPPGRADCAAPLVQLHLVGTDEDTPLLGAGKVTDAPHGPVVFPWSKNGMLRTEVDPVLILCDGEVGHRVRWRRTACPSFGIHGCPGRPRTRTSVRHARSSPEERETDRRRRGCLSITHGEAARVSTKRMVRQTEEAPRRRATEDRQWKWVGIAFLSTLCTFECQPAATFFLDALISWIKGNIAIWSWEASS